MERERQKIEALRQERKQREAEATKGHKTESCEPHTGAKPHCSAFEEDGLQDLEWKHSGLRQEREETNRKVYFLSDRFLSYIAFCTYQLLVRLPRKRRRDRKSTRLNSSH